MLQTFKFVDSLETQKPKYLENKTIFFHTKKIIHHTLRATLWQKILFWQRELFSCSINVNAVNLTCSFNLKNDQLSQ